MSAKTALEWMENHPPRTQQAIFWRAFDTIRDALAEAEGKVQDAEEAVERVNAENADLRAQRRALVEVTAKTLRDRAAPLEDDLVAKAFYEEAGSGPLSEDLIARIADRVRRELETAP